MEKQIEKRGSGGTQGIKSVAYDNSARETNEASK